MRAIAAAVVLVIGASVCRPSAEAGAPPPPVTARFKRGTIEAKSWSGPLQGQGPWEFAGAVKLTSADLIMTCDRLKVWLTSDSRDWERVEAAGNIAISGRYLAADKTEWRVSGKAQSATYDAKAGQGMLKGSVQFRAVSTATGATISASADTLTYDVKTERFRFERGERPVQVEWTQPEQPGAESAGQQSGDSDAAK